ncbi:MAG: Rap1a/Tai family immunity protein [Pseudomonadota bacterium]
MAKTGYIKYFIKFFFYFLICLGYFLNSFIFAQAQTIPTFVTGNKFLGWCSAVKKIADGSISNASVSDDYNSFIAVSYALGVHDAYMENLSYLMKNNFAECYNKNYLGFKPQQLVLSVCKYLDNHPETLNYSAASIIQVVITSEYPIPEQCYNKKEKIDLSKYKIDTTNQKNKTSNTNKK